MPYGKDKKGWAEHAIDSHNHAIHSAFMESTQATGYHCGHCREVIFMTVKKDPQDPKSPQVCPACGYDPYEGK